jgi:small subunit ribosomal protein S4
MGDPKKGRKKYSKPRKSFQKDRIVKGKEIKDLYGLKNNREFLKAESTIRGKRATARKLLALDLETRVMREKELLDSLKRTGILQGTPTLEDVLTLTPEAILERRLQTIVWRKGLANTAKQARQFITHGHIAVEGKKVNKPAYIVTVGEEVKIAYFKKQMIIEVKSETKVTKEEKQKETKDAFEEAKGTEAPAVEPVKEEAKVTKEGEQ